MQKQQAFIPKEKPSSHQKKISTEHILGMPYYALLIILIVIPILMMILYSFQTDQPHGIFVISLTLKHYLRFLSEPLFIKTMGQALYLAGVSTTVTLIIGYPIAYIISRSKPRVQLLLLLLISAPMWINMLLRTRALQQVVEMINPDILGTNFIIIFGMSYLYLPFMVLPIFTVLNKMDENLFQSAADLGANKFQTIVKVVIPLSLTGILSGIMMVFLPAATTLVVPKYLGNNILLIGNLIEKAFLGGQYGYGAAISVLLAIIIMGFVKLIKKVDRYQGASHEED
jgi:spermidine/putrescine transport system permease protein